MDSSTDPVYRSESPDQRRDIENHLDMADQNPNQRANPTSRACLACRTAHIKCNGVAPICDRCVERGTSCVFVESRRGQRPAKKDRIATLQPSGTDAASGSQQVMLQHGRGSRTTSSSGSTLGNTGQPAGRPQHPSPRNIYNLASSSVSSESDLQAPRTFTPFRPGVDYALDLFYKNFYPSHPFTLPRRLHSRNPEFLQSVMRYVGKHFSPHPTTNTAAGPQNLYSAPDDAFKVQAFVLLVMTSFCRNEMNEGQVYLNLAVDLALQLGMNQREFAITHGENDPTIEECWRRTWWDLYIIDSLIAFFTGQTEISRLRAAYCNVLLPGDCESYAACSTSRHLRSYQAMQDRAFTEDGFEWSSYACKIEAIHLLNEAVILAPDTFSTTDSRLEIIDQRIHNFQLSLPTHKKQALKLDGETDEVMFGALMAGSLSEIALHRPRSSFIAPQNHYRTACTPNAVPGMTAVRYLTHDTKALRAANAITNLITVPSDLKMHTPCFTCALTVATTVQLPAMILNRPNEGASLKDRVHLAITAMGSISEVWPIAFTTKTQIAQFARDVLATNRDLSSTGSGSSSYISTPNMSETLDYQLMVMHDDWLVDLIGEAVDVASTDCDKTT